MIIFECSIGNVQRGIDIKEKVIKKPLDEWLLLPLKLSAHGM